MKDPRFAKTVLTINGLLPLAILCWDAANHQLGPNPTEAAIHTTGLMALIFLILSLTITPVRKLTGWNFLSHYRRSLGLFAFFYACIHFCTYFDFDRGLSIAGTIADTIKKPFILLGMLALVLMTPLAITSTNGMIKRLGAAKWKALHRLAYVAAFAGAMHFWMSQKKDHTLPNIFMWFLEALLLYRIVVAIKNRLARRRIATP
jgi:DMSO/TMAO reductase YedYZ heme-binding membrane subunit